MLCFLLYIYFEFLFLLYSSQQKCNIKTTWANKILEIVLSLEVRCRAASRIPKDVTSARQYQKIKIKNGKAGVKIINWL